MIRDNFGDEKEQLGRFLAQHSHQLFSLGYAYALLSAALFHGCAWDRGRGSRVSRNETEFWVVLAVRNGHCITLGTKKFVKRHGICRRPRTRLRGTPSDAWPQLQNFDLSCQADSALIAQLKQWAGAPGRDKMQIDNSFIATLHSITTHDIAQGYVLPEIKYYKRLIK